VSKRTDSPGPGLGSLGSAALTAASLLVVSGFAAVIGVVIAREFGRTDETDGFFAAYGVFVVVITASQAIRVAVLPPLTRARGEARLAGTTAGFATALAVIGAPLVLVAWLAADPLAFVLTGDGTEAARDACAEALRWIVPAAVCHLFVGLSASALAALDDYAMPALGYAVASAAGLALIVARVDEDGIAAVSWGMALSAAVALAIPLAALAWRAMRAEMPAAAARPAGSALHRRLGLFVAAAAIPLALQLAYVVSLPFAGRLGSGAVTSFGYAYLAATTLVGVTAFSIGLVSSVPLSRIGLDRDGVTRHVVAAVWVALAIVGAAVGTLALVGADLVEGVLGDAYGDDVGEEVAGLVVLLSAWMVVAVGVNVTFPLAFVARRLHALPWIGAAALVAQVGVAWVGSELFDLDGLALSLAVSTAVVLALLLWQLGALAPAARGIAVAALAIGALTCAAFIPPGLVLAGVLSAVVGLALYAALVLLLRPRGLRASWAYLRALR
jgi:peptidoglycan biosynthesis protein MviN/MurJ (putative lipid II flippase)